MAHVDSDPIEILRWALDNLSPAEVLWSSVRSIGLKTANNANVASAGSREFSGVFAARHGSTATAAADRGSGASL